uniref:probable membrane-associated kinase regulator 6 n=1 Tax=Erigeron canadensis TaxID=72917 RepID=UPI001CB92C15|nr:probable membrane-associated kinase regulator 6 [Erigeron canadensis]
MIIFKSNHYILPKILKQTMETSQPIAIESFSYSWLINQKSSLDRVFDYNDYNQEASINSVTNSHKSLQESQNFCFDLPYTPNVVHADEIFFNGRIIPKSVNQIRLYSCPNTPIVHFPHKNPSKYTKTYSQLLANWRISSKRVLGKCFKFLVRRKSTRVVDSSTNLVCLKSSRSANEQMINKRIEVKNTTIRRAKSWSHNSTNGSKLLCSPPTKSCDYNDGSIDEAIVHCKRSFEK